MSWAEGTLVGFDLETTSADVETARIVTATVVWVGPGEPVEPLNWLANPGIEIPAEATAIHRITTEHARAHGEPAESVVHTVANTLRSWWAQGVPVVGFNVSYDFTVLDREVRRCGLGEFTAAGPVLDPYVIDRGVDRYRKGSRKLTAVCEHYGVTLDDAHSSDADALAAVEVMRRIAEKYPDEIGAKSLRDLWTAQRGWHRVSSLSFATHLERLAVRPGMDEAEALGLKERSVDERSRADHWPIRPYVEAVAA